MTQYTTWNRREGDVPEGFDYMVKIQGAGGAIVGTVTTTEVPDAYGPRMGSLYWTAFADHTSLGHWSTLVDAIAEIILAHDPSRSVDEARTLAARSYGVYPPAGTTHEEARGSRFAPGEDDATEAENLDVSPEAAEAVGQRDRTAELRRLAEMPDGAPLPEQSREFFDLPATRYCATPAGLRDLFEEMNITFGGNIGGDRIEKELAGAESAASAAQALGYRKIRFGLQVTDSQGNPPADGVPPTDFKVTTEFRDPAWPVPKIGLGCIAAAHVRHGGPSDNLRDLGYRDPEDVAARARAYTARTGARLPVPGGRAAPFRPGHDPALVPVVAVAFSGSAAGPPTFLARPPASAGQGTTTPGIRPGRIDFPEPVTTVVQSAYRAGSQAPQRRAPALSQVARAIRERLARTAARPGSLR